jgi:hypothetical protein
MCPECGTSVRTTLLAVVDPLARELRPIHHPRLTSLGLIVWSSAALLAALCVWLLRAEDFLSRPRAASPAEWLPSLVVAFAALSALASTVLVAPHDDIPPRHRWAAILGVSAYVPLVFFLYLLHVRLDPTTRPPYAHQAEILPERLILRFCISLLLVAILLLLRPNARLLFGRWVLMRLGAVDRQAMLSMSIVVAVWTLGDLLRFLTTFLQGALADALRLAGTGSVLLGSLLFTVGLASIVLDSCRLRPILAQPPLDLDDLTDASPPPSSTTIPNP